ncbi:MAG: N-acetylmuramoyl-L-alanine amidase [Chloroflexota bacterium]
MDENRILCYDTSMQQARKPKPKQTIQRKTTRRGVSAMFLLGLPGLAALTMLVGFNLFGYEPKPVVRMAQPPLSTAPTVSAMAYSGQPILRADGSQPLVGIVSGHKGYDPGAVCDDGLTEAEVNYAVAVEVIKLLERRGIRANLLDEFDERLTEYQADALVSIHADSCMFAGATGFKAARVTNSAIPAAEDRLVECLNQEYGRSTGLPQHPASITDNMTNYHAFNEIAPLTPGAIIETGFLLEDRSLLQYKPKIVARGIAAGIICFLHSS